MKITRITRHPRGDRVRLHLDDLANPTVDLALDLVLAAGLATGHDLDPARLDRLRQDDALHRARDAALRLLAHRARPVAELRRRLEGRGTDPATVRRVLEWLDGAGYLDDRAFAEAFVRDRLRFRPRGRRILHQELTRRGVDPATAKAALAAVLEAEQADEPALALDAARAWARRNASLLDRARRSRETRPSARRRLYAYLARRGFAPADVRAAVDHVVP